MGAWGAIIMGFFGAVFAAMTTFLQFGSTGLVLGVPFAVFGAIALAAILVIRRPGEGISHSRQGGRVIMWSSIGEGVGLFFASNLIINLGHPELLLPATALVVGLHFLPMAYGVSFRPFYAVGFILVAVSCLGFVIGQPLGGELAGFGAAAALWWASLRAIRRDLEAKTT